MQPPNIIHFVRVGRHLRFGVRTLRVVKLRRETRNVFTDTEIVFSILHCCALVVLDVTSKDVFIV